MASFTAWHITMYSASTVESVTNFCLIDFHEIAPNPRQKTYALVIIGCQDCLPSLSLRIQLCKECHHQGGGSSPSFP